MSSFKPSRFKKNLLRLTNDQQPHSQYLKHAPKIRFATDKTQNSIIYLDYCCVLSNSIFYSKKSKREWERKSRQADFLDYAQLYVMMNYLVFSKHKVKSKAIKFSHCYSVYFCRLFFLYDFVHEHRKFLSWGRTNSHFCHSRHHY